MRWEAGGILHGAVQLPSPNCDHRPPGMAVDLVVIHAISLPPGDFGGTNVAALFQNRLDPGEHPYFAGICGLRVASHFYIDRSGALFQFVRCDMRAWHAGASVWQGRERCNDFSIGIELEGADDVPFESIQYEMLDRLLAAVRTRYPIGGVVGHSDIAPGRKTDPGPCFDWSRVAR